MDTAPGLAAACASRWALARLAETWRSGGRPPCWAASASWPWPARCARRRARCGACPSLAAVTLLPPFVNPVAFFPQDVPRLLIYVAARWPFRSPSLAVQRVSRGRRRPRRRRPLARAHGASGPARRRPLLAALSPLALDRYRRADLRGPRDGPL